jgi:hypothetical protein
MGAAWLIVRADLRRRRRPMLAMALLIGLVSGVVLVAAAGARRTDTEYAAAQRAIQPEAVALAIFAALAGLIALAVLGQLLNRQLVLDSAEFPILRAFGMSRHRLALLSLARVALVTAAGAVVAIAVAVAASPLMPIGPARFAEPSPGIDVSLPILGIGFAVIALAPLLA